MNKTVANAQFIRNRGLSARYRYGLVLDTGLSSIRELLRDDVAVPHAEIPGFSGSNRPPAFNDLVGGTIEGFPALMLTGRSPYHETGDPAAMRGAFELMAALGVETLLQTTSAGSVNRDVPPGQLCIIRDHINLTGLDPLVGDGEDGRFVNMAAAYGPKLRARLRKAASDASVRVAEATYMFRPGPSSETPAETRAAKLLGADLVGMAVAPETVIARRLGMDVGAIAVVTNYAAGIDDAHPTQEAMMRLAGDRALSFRRLITCFFRGLGDAV